MRNFSRGVPAIPRHSPNREVSTRLPERCTGIKFPRSASYRPIRRRRCRRCRSPEVLRRADSGVFEVALDFYISLSPRDTCSRATSRLYSAATSSTERTRARCFSRPIIFRTLFPVVIRSPRSRRTRKNP